MAHNGQRGKRWGYWLFCLLIGVVGLGAGTAVLHAQITPLSMADYRALVATTADQFSRPAPPPAATREALASQWAEITAVQLPDGRIIRLDSQAFAAQLRTAEVDTVAAQLEALDNALDAPPSAWSADRYTAAQQKLATILTNPPFQAVPSEPTAWQEWQGYIWERLNYYLSRLFPSNNRVTDISLLQILFYGAAILALGFVANLVIRTLMVDFVREADLELSLQGGQRLTAQTAWQQAQTEANAGDYRTAVRYLYLSTLLSLEERQLLRYDRSLTNREYLRSVAHKPHLFALLRDVVDVFDRVWYGYQPIDEETFQLYSVRVADLQKVKE